jgi:WD40 repeat protein
LAHKGAVLSATFSPKGRQFLTACEDGGVRVWNLLREEKTPEYLIALTQLLSGCQIHAAGGLMPLRAEELKTRLQYLRTKFPGEFAFK